MAQQVATYAAKKMLAKQLKDFKDKDPAGPYDPYYEYRIDPRSGRKKKMKKQIPSYIPEHDANVLAGVRKMAYRLDCSLFSFMGIRFGVSSVIGLIPVIGDGADGVLALNTVRKCTKINGGLPQSVLIQMMFWIVIDFVIGLVPFVGDLLDASIKANTRNCRLLEQHLDKKYKPREIIAREKDERAAAKRASRHYAPPAPATVYEDMSDDDGLPRYEEARPANSAPAPAPPSRPQPTQARDERRGGARPERSGSKGIFSGGRSGGRGGRRNQRPSDVEMAQPARR